MTKQQYNFLGIKYFKVFALSFRYNVISLQR